MINFLLFWLKVHMMQKGPPSWQFLLWPYNMYYMTKKTCFFCQTVKNVHWINLILHVLCDISLKHKFVTPRSLHLCYLVTHPFLCTCQFFNFSALFKKIIRYWWHSGNWEEKLIRCIAMVAKLLDDNKTKIHHY